LYNTVIVPQCLVIQFRAFVWDVYGYLKQKQLGPRPQDMCNAVRRTIEVGCETRSTPPVWHDHRHICFRSRRCVEYDSMHYPFFFLISGSRRYGVWVEISQKFVLLRRSRSSAYHFTRSPGDVLRGLSAFGAVFVILIPLSIFSFHDLNLMICESSSTFFPGLSCSIRKQEQEPNLQR